MNGTLPELMASWVRQMRSERKTPGTVKSYTDGVLDYLRWCADNDVAPELHKCSVQDYVTDLLDRGLQPATAIARLKGLRRFSAWLADEDELDADPLLGVKSPRLDSKVVDALTDTELKALLKACEGKAMQDKRDYALVLLMAETGLRAGEVIALQMSDVDLDRGLITVRRGKGGKGRVVPIRPQTVTAIDRYIRSRRAHRLADALWVGVGGKTFGYHGLDGAMKKRAQIAGIAGFYLHVLRHTAATRWLRAGGSEQGLMAVAGWSQRSMLDRYTNGSAAERAADEARGLDLDL